MPSAAVARPNRCPECGGAGAPVGQHVGLHGHGHRERVQLGCERFGGDPVVRTVVVRRYQCQRCRSVVIVAPRGVLPSLRYAAFAIALALSLWSAERVPGHRVRECVSPLVSHGYEQLHGWRSLTRWATSGTRIFGLRAGPDGDARTVALEVTRKLAARAPTTCGRLTVDACTGALFP